MYASKPARGRKELCLYNFDFIVLKHMTRCAATEGVRREKEELRIDAQPTDFLDRVRQVAETTVGRAWMLHARRVLHVAHMIHVACVLCVACALLLCQILRVCCMLHAAHMGRACVCRM